MATLKGFIPQSDPNKPLIIIFKMFLKPRNHYSVIQRRFARWQKNTNEEEK